MKYSKLVKLAQDTQMHKQAAPSGRDIAITAGSGALSGLAGYALARLAGASNKKALGIGAGAGVAGAGLGYVGSAYGNQIAGGIKGQLARALARFRKGESPYNLKPEDNKTPIGEHPRNKTPYTKKNLTKTKRSPATTPAGDSPGYDYEGPAAQAQQALYEAQLLDAERRGKELAQSTGLTGRATALGNALAGALGIIDQRNRAHSTSVYRNAQMAAAGTEAATKKNNAATIVPAGLLGAGKENPYKDFGRGKAN